MNCNQWQCPSRHGTVEPRLNVSELFECPQKHLLKYSREEKVLRFFLKEEYQRNSTILAQLLRLRSELSRSYT